MISESLKESSIPSEHIQVASSSTSPAITKVCHAMYFGRFIEIK